MSVNMRFTTYYKNFILCGDLDYNCLLCDENFDDYEDIDKHIRWENHRKKLKAQSVLPQPKHDGIHKIENYFYCMHCNHVSFNFKSIKEHVANSSHALSKTNPSSHPNNNNTIDAYYDVSENVVINNTSISINNWNGITKGKCLLCDKTVSKIKQHIEEQDHVIRLIQGETKIEGSVKCYRKINETTVQCFKCMKLFTPEECEKHWPIHKFDLNSELGEPVRVSWEEHKEVCKTLFDIENLANIPDEYYKVDLKKRAVICKLCNSAIRNTYRDLTDHMFDAHNLFKSSKICDKIRKEIEKRYVWVEENDSGKKRHELAVFGKENYIKLDAGGTRGYCTLCDRFLCCSMRLFEEHVEGTTHMGHLEMKGLIKQKKQRKKPTSRLESFASYVKTMEYIFDDESVVVNDFLCIDRHSLLFLKRIKHGKHFRVTKCLVCEETFKWWKEREHCETSLHKSYVLGAKVMCADMMFVREVKPKLYHCGVCNITLPYFDSLEKHLRDMGHKMQTTSKSLNTVLKSYMFQGGVPAHDNIEHSNVNDKLYSNIVNKLFETQLGFRIYSITLDEEASEKQVKE